MQLPIPDLPWSNSCAPSTRLARPDARAAYVQIMRDLEGANVGVLLTSRNAFTLPTVFRSFLSFQGAQYGEASALAIVSLVPSIILGVLVQKHLVRGLTLGAIRG